MNQPCDPADVTTYRFTLPSGDVRAPEPLTPAEAMILDSFRHRVPTENQTARIQWLREQYEHLARWVITVVSTSADRTAALRMLHESMMTANKAIACENPADWMPRPAPR